MTHGSGRGRGLLLAALAAVAATACVDEKVIYRDQQRFEQPAAAAAGFVGYARAADTATVCGNCHSTTAAQWKGTAHAHAWETLQASGSAQPFCEGCHTVNARGNSVPDTTPAGWTATKDVRYHDVQCESCHGPGLTHISAPTRENIPLPVLKVVDRADTSRNFGCAECHNGTHHPFVEEWKLSNHGTMATSWSHGAAANASCQPCHTGQGALKAWGVVGHYAEENYAHGDTLQIVCAVCHDPHNKKYDKQLRYAVDAQTEQDNLCMKCHSRRPGPDPNGTSGTSIEPHAPEAALVLGYAGYWTPQMGLDSSTTGRPTDSLPSTHGSEANPRLCATCHVYRFQAKDSVTGAFTFQVTGHRFLATPCINANGEPVRNQPPLGGSCTEGTRTYRSCVGSGCHGSESAAQLAESVARNRIDRLAGQLEVMLAQVLHNDSVSPYPAPRPRDLTDKIISSWEGAHFNATLAEEKPGSPVHNPFLMEALLIGSIKQVQQIYGVNPPATLSLQIQLRKH